MTKNGIDLASFDTKAACEKGFELELRNPFNSEPLGVFISVVGTESEMFQGHVRRKADEKLKSQVMRRNRPEEAPTVAQIERDSIALLAACTTGWRTVENGESKPTITHGGKPLEFNEANAKFLYANKWIREQVDDAIGDLGNFTQA